MAYEPKPGIVTKFVDLVANKSKLVFGISVFFVLILAPGLSKFSEKYDVRIWFKDDDPMIKVLDKFEKQFGNDESLVIVMHSPSGMFDEASSNTLRDLTERIWKIHQVVRVDSLTNYNYTHAEGDDIIVESFFPESSEPLESEMLAGKKKKALAHKVMPGYLISKDGNSAMIFARLATTLDGSPNYEKIIGQAREILKDYENKHDHEFHILGEAAVNDAFREVALSDAGILLPCLIALVVIYLIFVFHSFVAMLFPMMVTVVSTVMTLGLQFYLGYDYNNIMAILPAILISISIADSVHVLVTYFQFRGMGKDKREAAYLSMHKNFIPTLLTSLSTMIGFFSLTMTTLEPIRQLGLFGGIGTAFAWLITIFLMGPLLFWVPFKVPPFFLRIQNSSEGSSEFAKRCVEKINHLKVPILLFFSGVAIASIFMGAKIEVNSNPYKYFTKGLPIRIANNFVSSSFGGNSGPELMIHSGTKDGIKDPFFLSKVEKLKNWIDSREYVNKTIDIVDIIKDMNQNLHEGKDSEYKIPDTQNAIAEELFLYSMSLPQGMDLNNRMTLDYADMRMSVLWSIQDTNGWLKHVSEIEEKAKELDLNVEATGKFLLFQRMMEYVVMTFFKSIVMAMFLIGILMMILFKSVRLGIISLIPNVIPIAFGGALLYFAGIPLNIGSALVASVCMGIAVDDTIHFLANFYRLKKEGLHEEQAIASIYTFTGSALIVTTFILASAFGLYVFGDFVPNIHFGLLCSIVLIGALIVDLVFLPALLLQLAEWRDKKCKPMQNNG